MVKATLRPKNIYTRLREAKDALKQAKFALGQARTSLTIGRYYNRAVAEDDIVQCELAVEMRKKELQRVQFEYNLRRF